MDKGEEMFSAGSSVTNNTEKENLVVSKDKFWIDSNDRRKTSTHEVGNSNALSANYESLNYDICENVCYLEEERRKGYSFVMRKSIWRWMIFILIGMCTAFVGVFIDISIEEIGERKYGLLKKYFDKSVPSGSFMKPTGFWIISNMLPVLIGSLLVTYIEPIALGSGIPQVKCYLNGINMPRLVRFKTLFVKCIGVITTVVGGLAGGKEGPMIHSGSVVAAGISQGKSTSLKMDLGILKFFREDHEKRDFVSGGAAAGVAAAFGAPVGGVLFSLEEGASFWNQSLTWRIFISSMVSTFTLNVILSAYKGNPGELNNPGLLNFGQFHDLSYNLQELIIFIFIGATGGILGALFNHINYKLTVFRIRYMKVKLHLKVIEAVIVAAVSAIIPIMMMYAIHDCKSQESFVNYTSVKMFCPDGKLSTPAILWLQVPEKSVRSFFHQTWGSFDKITLIVFSVIYYFLSVFTYGLSVSGGIFIPQLVLGAAWGRLVGEILKSTFYNYNWGNIGKFSLAGAAAQLGGVVRMTISLTVILIEATGDISFGLPLMIILITSKWVGDFFNEGLYDLHIGLSGIPLLGWDPPPLSTNIFATELMSYPLVTFNPIEKVSRIIEVLKNSSHNGFPVVDANLELNFIEPRPVGHLRGLILRHQLLILLKNKAFNEHEYIWDEGSFNLEMFRQEYPRYPKIEDIHITEEEKNYTIDLRMAMNPSPYVVQHTTSLPRAFRVFRALGLRHLIVINDNNEAIGIITRKDLARYKVTRHLGKIYVEEMKITNDL